MLLMETPNTQPNLQPSNFYLPQLNVSDKFFQTIYTQKILWRLGFILCAEVYFIKSSSFYTSSITNDPKQVEI